ncbi:MAG: aldehyde dehydrogenase family protein [Steroidobacteraceae bacterium]
MLPPIHGAIPVQTTVAYQPLGVVTIIVPFNWPVAILGAALPHALLAGNTVIVKPPLTTPLATARIVQRIAEQLPPGVLNVVTGVDANMSALIRNTDVAKVCFHRLGQWRQEDDGTCLAESHPRHARAGRK